MSTRTPETCEAYIKKAVKILARYEKSLHKSDLTLDTWLRRYTTTITARTWTTYRAALLYSLSNNKVSMKKYNNHDALTIIVNLKNLYPMKRSESKATSRKKYKHLPLKIYETLKATLKKGHSRYDRIIYHWLRATRATGLRPVEWTTLTIRADKTFTPVKFILVVNNAKETNNRSFGKQRTIHVQAPALTINSILYTWKTLKNIYSEGGSDAHDRYYKGCRDRLRWVNGKIGCKGAKKRITLYSARHQFKADLELQKKTREEIAALMGHGSIATATINHANKRFSRETDTVVNPSKADLEKVTQMNIGRDVSMPAHIAAKIELKTPTPQMDVE